MTYHAHDVDDGLEAGLITEDDLEELELWRRAHRRARDLHPAADAERLRLLAVRNLLDLQVEDVLHTTAERLARWRPESAEAVRSAPGRIVAYSDAMRQALEPLHAFLFRRVYFHPAVADANRQSVELMRLLFMHYVEHPDTMGRKARARVETEGLWRTACDYVAGMTDRYALEEVHRFHLGPSPE